jgi:hypothetical protein
MTPLGNKDICWLDISMDNAFRVRGVKPVGNVNRDIQQFLQFHGPAGDVVFQRLAFQILHCDECLSAFFADVVNGADVVVIQRGSGLCFPLESS